MRPHVCPAGSGGAAIAEFPVASLAPACSACQGWHLIPALAEGNRLVRYVAPKLSDAGGREASEPVVVTVRIDARGRVCDAVLSRGKASRNIQSIIAAIREWEFGTWRTASGGPVCVRTRFYIYIRREAGRMVVIIPGVTDRPRAQRMATKDGAR